MLFYDTDILQEGWWKGFLTQISGDVDGAFTHFGIMLSVNPDRGLNKTVKIAKEMIPEIKKISSFKLTDQQENIARISIEKDSSDKNAFFLLMKTRDGVMPWAQGKKWSNKPVYDRSKEVADMMATANNGKELAAILEKAVDKAERMMGVFTNETDRYCKRSIAVGLVEIMTQIRHRIALRE